MDNSKNLHETWKGIKNIIQMQNNTDSFPTCILYKGSSITDPRITFNPYFPSIGKYLQSKIHYYHWQFSTYLKYPNIHSLFLSPKDNRESHFKYEKQKIFWC